MNRATLPRPRTLKWLLWASAEELTAAEYGWVEQVCHHSRDVILAYGLVTYFRALVHERQGGELGSWVALAQASGAAELAGFARGLLRDWQAVRAGLELEWSSGPVEGQVNRLKMLKRQMYGLSSTCCDSECYMPIDSRWPAHQSVG